MVLDGDWTQSLRHAGKHSFLPLSYNSPLPNHNLFKNLVCQSSNMISVKKTLHIWFFLYGIILEGTKKKACDTKQTKTRQWKAGGAKARDSPAVQKSTDFHFQREADS